MHGWLWSVNGDLLEKLNQLSLELDLPELSEQEPEGLHRLPAKRDETPAPMVRSSSRERKKLLQKRGQLQGKKITIPNWRKPNTAEQ